MANICPCTMGNSISTALFNMRNAKKLNQDQEEPEQTASASVLSRRVDTSYSLTKASSSWAYLVKFRVENGEELELYAEEGEYQTLKEGMSGTLRWQGRRFCGFDSEGV